MVNFLAVLLLAIVSVATQGPVPARRPLAPAPAPAPLSGRVLFPDNAPAPGILLQAVDETGAVAARTRSGRDGAFRFPELAPGPWRVVPVRPGIRRESAATSGRAGESGLVLVVPGWRVRFRLQAPGEALPQGLHVRIQVLDPARLRALGITVPEAGDFARFTRRSLTLAADLALREGFWSATPSWIRVEARAPGFFPGADRLLLGSGPRDELLDLYLAPRPDAGRLRVLLPERREDAPPLRLRLVLLPVLDGPDAAWEEATVSSGGLSPLLPPGRYRLDVEPLDQAAGRWLPWSGVAAEVPPAGEGRVELRLRPGGRLLVEAWLLGWRGEPAGAPRPWLELRPLDGQTPPARLRQQVAAAPPPAVAPPPQEGEPPPLVFRIRPAPALAPGRWRLRVRAGNRATPWQEVRVAVGRDLQVQARLSLAP